VRLKTQPAEAGTPARCGSNECVVARPLPILAEMREHPGGSGLNMATFAAVQPDSSRCSATIALAPGEDRPATRGHDVPTAATAHAVRAKLLVESPAADQWIGPEVNRERDHYVDRFTTERILAECDLVAGRLRIDSVKTGLRFCLIFPELRPLLEAARYLAPDGAVYCVRRYRGNATNLRTQLGRILGRVGVIPWPKLFVNLRASARTDLQEVFPSHVCDSWLGHCHARGRASLLTNHRGTLGASDSRRNQT
jgi:hypothetical protein